MKNMGFKAMLAAISLLGVVPVSVNAFINHHSVADKNVTDYHSFAQKTLLSDVIKEREVQGKDASDADSLLAELLILNPDLKIADVEVLSFYKPTEISPGAAMVNAKVGTDYSGLVGITITPLPKIALSSVITVAQVRGQNAANEAAVLKQVEYLNPRLTIADVEVKSFTPSTETKTGTAVIAAIEGTKYTGEVTITVTVLPKINLNEVINIREVDGVVANDEKTILTEVARLNPDLDVNDVQVGDFKEASQFASGEATIIAKTNTKYTDQVTIVINSLPKTILSSVITNRIIDGTVANDEKTILTEIKKLNPDLNLASIEIRYFNKATNLTPGSVVISAITNGIYTGQVGITINPLTNFFFNKELDDDQNVVDAINSTEFTKSIMAGSTVDALNSEVNTKFIKDRLIMATTSSIVDDLFTVNKITTNKNQTLIDHDLSDTKLLTLTVNYNYGSITNQNFQLFLTVKKIIRSSDRDGILRDLKVKSDKNEDDIIWSDLWFSYFKQVQTDISTFSFEFPKENLNQNQILQNIIYDEIKLVMESDFGYWQIDKGYNPNSIVVTYDIFNVDESNQELSVAGRLAIQVKAYGTYVKHSVLLGYNLHYNVLG